MAESQGRIKQDFMFGSLAEAGLDVERTISGNGLVLAPARSGADCE